MVYVQTPFGAQMCVSVFCQILQQNNFAINHKNGSDFAPIFTYLVEGHFLHPKSRDRYGKSKIEGGKIITNLPNSGFNNGIYQTAQDSANIGATTHHGKEQGKNLLAEKGISEAIHAQPLPTLQPPMFQKTLGNTLYTVSVHFSHTSTESFEDKILRMLESAVV